MAEREIRNKIAKIIMNIEKPFSISGLLFVCRQNQINDVDLILEVLDDLCDAGLVSYSEIQDDCWAYTAHS
jgi:hypothetical protein